MTAQPTHWLAYGEPIDGEKRVEATHRITYMTGPNESREDDVTEGTLTHRALDLGWNANEQHVHEDGSLCLSRLPAHEHDRIMEEFEPNDSDE